MREPARVDEREIVDGYVRGDPEALRRVDHWVDVVLHDRFRSLWGDWDDVRQEVRIRLYRNLRHALFDGRSALRTYVHRLTCNVGVDFTRRRRSRRESPFTDDLRARLSAGDPDAASEVADRDLLTRGCGALSEDDRLLLRMVCGHRRSYAEVARDLGITEGAVKVRVHRLKIRLVERCRDLQG